MNLVILLSIWKHFYDDGNFFANLETSELYWQENNIPELIILFQIENLGFQVNNDVSELIDVSK